MNDRYGSPPSYDGESDRDDLQPGYLASPSKNHKGGYVSVALEPPFPLNFPDSTPLNFDSDDSNRIDVASLGLTAHDGVYSGQDDGRCSADNLFQLLSAQKATCVPAFHLAIKGLNKFDSNLFTITVALPRIQPTQGTLYVKSDDCPSFRLPGARPLGTDGWRDRLANISSKWPLHYTERDNVHCWNNVSSILEPATSDTLQHWNTRREHNLIPPWIGLDQKEGEGEQGILKGNEEDYKVKDLLQRYLQWIPNHLHRRRFWSKWLIVSQVAYGWDIDMLESELNKMIPSPTLGRSNVTRIKVDIVSPKPLLALRLFSEEKAVNAYKFMENIHLFFFLLLFLSLYTFITAFILFVYRNFWIGFAVMLSGGLLATPLIFPSILYLQEAIDDTMGVAWALKGWEYLNISPSCSRSEVIAELKSRMSTSLFHGHFPSNNEGEDGIKLQRRSNSWYLLVGTREGDWLNANRRSLQKAIENQKSVVLNSEADNELLFVRARNNRWEGDDAVGLMG